MNRPAVEKWVAALRSGEYGQVQSQLAREYPSGKRKYCCLGVACELAIKDGVPVNVTLRAGGGTPHRDVKFDGNDGSLPSQVSDWLDIEGGDPKVIDSPVQGREGGMPASWVIGDSWWLNAADLNDTLGLSFDQIADCVEWSYLSGGEPADAR